MRHIPFILMIGHKELANNLAKKTHKQNFLSQAKLSLSPPSPAVHQRLARAETDRLTVREAEIAGLVAQGKATREIALELVLSKRTAVGYVFVLMLKALPYLIIVLSTHPNLKV